MKTAETFLRDFLAARRLSEPSGQPLYSYRIEPQEFDELGALLAQELHVLEFGRRWIGPKGAMAFCLWASEWWHQNYEAGAWKWMPLLTALGMPELAPGGSRYGDLQDLVTRGLRGWGRTVYRVGPSRGYLATLACEGGLPLKLILREGTRLRHYLKGVLEEFKHFGATEIPARDLAERLRDRLPRAWRREAVYELAGELIESVWLLQHEVGETDSPVQDLDRKMPGWRDELPVRISDQVARTLLNDLLIEAVEVARRARINVRWNVDLVPVADGDWEVRGSFHIPVTMSEESFSRLFSCWSHTAPPRRFDLGVETAAGRFRVLALGTERRGDGTRTFRLDPFPAARRAETAGLTDSRQLLARTHNDRCPTDRFQGSSGLGDAAWVFVPRESGDAARPICRLVGQGSVRVKEPVAFVAVDTGLAPGCGSGEAEAKRVGALRNESQRVVYRVKGRVSFRAEDGCRTVVETDSASDAANVEYHLVGPQKRFGVGSMSAFLGGPSMYLRHDGEPVKRIPERDLQWKPDVPGGRWRTFSSAAVDSGSIRGSGWIRYVKDGQVRQAMSLCVLPKGADIEILPSADPDYGEVRLVGFGDVVAIASDTQGLTSKGWLKPNGYRLALSARGNVPREVGVVVDWGGQGRAVFMLPFPARRAAFVAADDTPMPPEARLAQGSLAGVRAEVIVPHTASFEVLGQYCGGDAAAIRGRFGKLVREIPAVSFGHHVLDLAELDHGITERLALTDSPDAAIRLTIADTALRDGLQPASVFVSRFDLGFEIRDDRSTLVGLDARGRRISPADLSLFTVEILPLLEPDQGPIPLKRLDSDIWRIPERSLEAGPHLILGRQGDWHRVRPMPWYLAQSGHAVDPDPSAVATVAQAYLNASRLTRSSDEAFGPVVGQLARDPGHPDWPLVFGYLRQTSLPVATFPLLRALVRNPVACAMAAAHASAEDFELLWQRMELFPFAWWQIPLCSWEDAYVGYGAHWERVLESVEDSRHAWKLLKDETDRSIGRVAGRLEGLRASFRFLSARVTSRPISDKGSKIVTPDRLAGLKKEYDAVQRSCPALRMTQHDLPKLRDLHSEATRLTANHSWCRSLFVSRTGPFEHPRCADFADAPALTAGMVVAGIQTPEGLAHRIRELHVNHRNWFDKALKLAQFIAFGGREADKIARQLENLS